MAVLTGRITLPSNPNPMTGRSGFFNVSTGPLDLPVEARSGGIQYQTAICSLPNCYAVTCLADHTTKVLDDGLTLITGDPFIIYSDLLCSPVGIKDPAVKTFLMERLTSGEQLLVEDVFSQQLCGQAPGLSDNASVDELTPAAADPVDAVSQLETALYSVYGQPGVLHVPYRFAAYFEYLHLAERVDGKGVWRTKLGTLVNFGNYAGLDPTGGDPAGGSLYIYITGQTTVWRTPDSDLFVTSIADTLSRTTNQFTAVMEREYVVSFDCQAFAIETPITGVVE
jgi:hypothetical protein